MASKINADEFVDREGEGKPTLPKGVVLSGVTTITTAVVAENEVANSTGINVGIITSTHFAGNLTGDVNAGIVTVTSQTVVGSAVTISASGIDIGAGVITATSYSGSAANLTGIGATIMVWEYNPDPNDRTVAVDVGIGITFNQKIKAGSGNITIREDSSSGTVVENFGIGSSVTISANELSFTPTSDLSQNQVYYLEFPSGVITNMAGDSYVGTGYTFQTAYTFNQLWMMGANEYGELGQNSEVSYSSPVQVPGTNWRNGSAILDGDAAVWGMKTDGTLWGWGFGGPGAVGVNNRTNYSSPVQIPGTTWNDIAGGSDQVIANKTDNTLWVWGTNAYGQLGQGNEVSYSSPVQIPGTSWGTGRKQIASSRRSLAAIRTDGTLWTWGGNYAGRCGVNIGPGGGNGYFTSPKQIPGSSWSKVEVAGYINMFLRTDGTLWGAGWNSNGGLGQNNRTDYSSPVQIPGTTWTDICGTSRDEQGFIGLKTDGTLWSWGEDYQGSLGLNQQGAKLSSPVQIGSDTTWSAVDMLQGGAIANKTDGTIWAWGFNYYGQLGQNSVHPANYSSPVQIPGTNWGRPFRGTTYNTGIIKEEQG